MRTGATIFSPCGASGGAEAAAGLAGVGGIAGRLILIDRPAIIEAADRLGLFVWGEERS